MNQEAISNIEAGIGESLNGRKFLVPYFVLFVCLTLTVATTIVFYYSARAKDETRYTAGVNRITNAIRVRMAIHLALLQSTKGFVDVDAGVDRTRFGRFVETLDIENGYTGIQGIGYTHIFKRSERDGLVARMQAEGESEFRPYPDSTLEVQQAIIYLFPRNERNQRAIGYDMSSEERRRKAIERARDEGLAIMSGPVTLVQEITKEKQAGFLVYLPIYEEGHTPDTMEMRRSKVRGFVYAPFRAGNFFSEVERTVGSDDIAFEVYDTSVDPQNLLSKSLTVSDTDVGRKSIWSHLSSTSEIEVAGRKWVVLNTTGESFASQSILWWTPLVAFVGFALTGILFAMTRRQAASREKLRSVAAELFVSEREKHRLLVREQETREAAETANVVKDEFLSVVSHELRTPLNAIAGWARVLRSPEVSPLMRESALDKVERNLKQQSSLVEDLITFSQIASRSLVLEREAVDLSSAVRSVLAELEPISVEKQISMVLQDPDGAVGVAGDAERIRLCIMKLVSNALKFTPNGGHVEVVVKAEEGFAELHVTDSGQGISQEFLPYVFEHFKQHDSSTTRKFAGLGLGLTIAERIIGLHGGTISVSSEGEGKGAEFTVRLPR